MTHPSEDPDDAAERLARWVADTVDRAPRLTDAQMARLARLLTPPTERPEDA